jgi:hypothetical protein
MAITLSVKKFADLRKLSGESGFVVAPSWVGSGRLLVHKDHVTNAGDYMRDGAFNADIVKAASGQPSVKQVTDAEVEKMIGPVKDYVELRSTKMYLRRPRCRPSEGEQVYIAEGEKPVLLGVPERNLAFLEHRGDIYARDANVCGMSPVNTREVRWVFLGVTAAAYDSYNRAEPGGDLYKDLAACVRVLEAQNPNLKKEGKAVQDD